MSPDFAMAKSGAKMVVFGANLAVFGRNGIPHSPTQPGSSLSGILDFLSGVRWINEFHIYNHKDRMYACLVFLLCLLHYNTHNNCIHDTCAI